MRIPLAVVFAVAVLSPITLVIPAQAQSAEEALPEAHYDAVQRHVDAYRSGNIDRFVATFTPNAVVYANGLVATGHSEIRALYQLNFEPGAPGIVIHDSYEQAGRIVLHIGYVMGDGQEICCSVSHYEVTDGKISYLQAEG